MISEMTTEFKRFVTTFALFLVVFIICGRLAQRIYIADSYNYTLF